MARIIKTIEIEGQPAVALFDSGAIYTYIRSDLVQSAPRTSVAKPVRVALGGQAITITDVCLFNGKIEGLDFFADAVPIARLGAIDVHQLDAIIGALTLVRWEIKLYPNNGSLDLEGLKTALIHLIRRVNRSLSVRRHASGLNATVVSVECRDLPIYDHISRSVAMSVRNRCHGL